MSHEKSRRGISRRAFFGAAAGSAALGILRPGQAAGHMLRDYTGRLCYNENPLGPSPLAMTAMTDSIPEGHRYSDWFAESLRGDLAEIHEVSVSQVIAGCGATEILRLAAHAFAGPDVNVVCPYPSYGQFGGDANFLGATVKYADLDPNYRVDLDAMAALVDGNTAAVCITNANNPTGTVLPASALEAFVDGLPEHVAVLVDEAYHEYIQDASYASAMELVRQEKNVTVVRTFSKTFGMAGVRIGYAVGRGAHIGAMRNWQIFGTVSRLGLTGARAALGDSQHVTDTVTLNDQAKQYCFGEFIAMGLEFIPSETNFFMVNVGEGPNVAGELADRGIYVRTGWGMPEFLRVSTGTMEEMEAFIAALQEILAAMAVAGPTPVVRVTALNGNFPNPFRTGTRITYALAGGGAVRLEVFDVHGRLVRTLVEGQRRPGRHRIDWNGAGDDGRRLPAGSYFYRLQAGETKQTRRLIIL